VRTVKDVNFAGMNDEYVVSGSDDGNVFVWDRKSSQLVSILEGDGEVVNVVQGHPYEPMLAVSGIDSSIKIFSADKRARREARLGLGVAKVDDENFSSIQWGRSRRARQRAQERQSAYSPAALGTEDDEPSEYATGSAVADGEDDSDPDETGPATPNGLASRKRMHDVYRITSKNDADRRGGMRGEGMISADVMALIAGRIRAQMANGEGFIIGGQGEQAEGEEGCVVQ